MGLCLCLLQCEDSSRWLEGDAQSVSGEGMLQVQSVRARLQMRVSIRLME